MPKETTPEASWYTSEEQFRTELTKFLYAKWHFLCPTTALANPGDIYAATIMEKGVLAQRGTDNRIRSFLNVCRHRGGLLANAGKSHATNIRCHYHGWCYDESGNLIQAPDFSESKSDIDLSAYSLAGVEVAEWKGLVFVSLTSEPESLEESLGDLPRITSDFDTPKCADVFWESMSFNCNWKLYVENWLESYHFPWVHNSLVRDVKVSDYSIDLLERVVEHRSTRRHHDSVYEGRWIWLFPNTAWNFYDCGFSIEHIVPESHNVTRVEYTFCFSRNSSLEARRNTLRMCQEVTGEDGEACEAVYRNMVSGIYQPGPLSPKHEHGLVLFHSLVRDAIS